MERSLALVKIYGSKNTFGRTVQRAPLADAALQRSELPVLEFPWVPLLHAT